MYSSSVSKDSVFAGLLTKGRFLFFCSICQKQEDERESFTEYHDIFLPHIFFTDFLRKVQQISYQKQQVP